MIDALGSDCDPLDDLKGYPTDRITGYPDHYIVNGDTSSCDCEEHSDGTEF